MFVYEPQLPLRAARTCGAAALCMVYRSLGLSCSQAVVWARLSGARCRGGVRTCTLARDAASRGLAVAIVQVQQPWTFLEACIAADVQVILNHRIDKHLPWGHYTVLERLDEQTIWLHDPQLGPSQEHSHDDFLELWRGAWGRSEIAGNVAILVTRSSPATARRTTLCPNCSRPISFAALPDCHEEMASLISAVYCLHCDWRLDATCFLALSSDNSAQSLAHRCQQ